MTTTGIREAFSASGYGTEGHVLAVAHRGGAGNAPENTVEAFERAVELGYRYLETDVRMTADGVCVAFHDRDLRRLTGTPGLLADTPWQCVRRLRVLGGAGVPRIHDVLTAWPDVRWMLDIKQPDVLPGLVDVVRRLGASSRVCLAGSWDGCLARGRAELGAELATSVGWQQLARLLLGVPARARGPRFAHVPLRLAGALVPTARLVDRAHSLGLRLLVWGVDDPALAQELFVQGVDGVITDRPDAVRDVAGAWGALDARVTRLQHSSDPGA